MTSIIEAIVAGAPHLAARPMPPEAPPAFLLDSRRRGLSGATALLPGTFDNRAVSLPADFPSANLLVSVGVGQVVVVLRGAAEPETDLAHTLRRWQEAELRMLCLRVDAPSMPQPLVVRRPSRFRHLWHAMLAMAGLRQNPLGGFGGYLPTSSSG